VKISGIEIFEINPAEIVGPGRTWLFVRVDTDEGISGWGEATNSGAGSNTLIKTAIDLITPDLVGEDPADIERLWHKMFRRFSYLGSRGLPTAMTAGIDIALWDIKGKATNRPIYDLLGGRFRNEVRLYANSWFEACETPDDYAKAARERVLPEKHTALKLDPFREMTATHHMFSDGQISPDGEQEGYNIVTAIREVVGPKHEILIDAHGHFNVPTAIRLANNLYEQSNIAWFEEPVTADDIPGCAEVRAATDIPIAAGESIFTRFDFRDLALARAVDIFQPDLAICGGITEAMRIGAIASAFQIRLAPHLWGGALMFAAGLHVSAASPAAHIIEYSLGANPMLFELSQEPAVSVDGMVEIPDRPGLGVTINEDFVKRYTVG
jgi:L-alanine-DL-glutamate epimerase-like enolase superfamily enzyme